MKILFVQKEGGIFGAENYHLNMIPALQERGITVEFLRLYTDYQLGRDSDFVKKLKQIQVNVYQVNIGRVPGIRDIREVAKTIKEGDYDIVHSHLIHADFYTALVRTFIRTKAKFVSTKHGYDNNFTAKHGFDASKQGISPYFLISRWAESKFDKSYTISKGLLNLFIQTGITSSDKMELIYYGFDLAEVVPVSPPQSYRKSSHQLCIAGRLVGFKGHLWGIEAVKKLTTSYPDIKLLIIGTGSFEPQLKKRVEELDLDKHVDFLGYRKDVGAWMKYSDVVLVPSRSEGFGVVFLEAFNARTPVVAFNVPAADELISNNESGLLAAPYDVSDLAAKINLLLQNRDMAEQYATAAYARAKKDFSLNTMVDNTCSFYNRVLQA